MGLSRPFCRPVESHELLREVYQQGNAKQIAADLGLSLSLIYKWAEPAEAAGSGVVNPLDRIEALVRSTNDCRLVQWLCERAGGFFIKNPKAFAWHVAHFKNPKAVWPHPHFLIPATNQIVQEFADLLAVVAKAADDNRITGVEAASIRARWEELKSVTESFVRCCEEGNFSAMRPERGETLKK